MKKMHIFGVSLLLAFSLTVPAIAGEKGEAKKAEKAQKAEKGEKAEGKGKKAYPLDTCIVSGEKLGEMGDPFVFAHEGREVKLCCKSCKKDFSKDPAKYMKKLDEAEKHSKK